MSTDASHPPPPRLLRSPLLTAGLFLMGGESPPTSFLELSRRSAGPRHLQLAPTMPGGRAVAIELPGPRRTPHYAFAAGPEQRQERQRAGRPTAPVNARSPMWDPQLLNPGSATPFIMPGNDAQMLLPMMTLMPGRGMMHLPPPQSPNILPHMQQMLALSLGKAGGATEKALAYGTMLASMGGMHGVRGASLKRIQTVERGDPEARDNQYVAGLNPFAKNYVPFTKP